MTRIKVSSVAATPTYQWCSHGIAIGLQAKHLIAEINNCKCGRWDSGPVWTNQKSLLLQGMEIRPTECCIKQQRFVSCLYCKGGRQYIQVFVSTAYPANGLAWRRRLCRNLRHTLCCLCMQIHSKLRVAVVKSPSWMSTEICVLEKLIFAQIVKFPVFYGTW